MWLVPFANTISSFVPKFPALQKGTTLVEFYPLVEHILRGATALLEARLLPRITCISTKKQFFWASFPFYRYICCMKT